MVLDVFGIADDDGDDVEADGHLKFGGFLNPASRALADVGDLAGIDGAQRVTEIIAGTRFHFNNNQCISVDSDEIDFQTPDGMTIVSGDDSAANLPLEVPVSKILTAPCQGDMGRGAPPAAAVAKMVE